MASGSGCGSKRLAVGVRSSQTTQVAPFADILAGYEESHGMLLGAYLMRQRREVRAEQNRRGENCRNRIPSNHSGSLVVT
jgi:hypothetical protein